MDLKIIHQFIKNAFDEDVQNGDFSSLSCIPSQAKGTAKLFAKESGIIAGIELAKIIFKSVDNNSEVIAYKNDGEKIYSGDIIFEVHCNIQSLLKAERLVLNCMQRMSGVATLTNQYVSAIQGTSAKLLDTRKTTPLFRYFEKWAVRIGGGHNHRFGLFDMMMLKDNHNDFAGGVVQAIAKANQYRKENNLQIPLEVETRSIEEVQIVLNCEGVQRIMFDNFKLNDLQTAVQLVNNKVETEASGGVNLHTIKSIAQTGVQYISVGAITHHYTSIDLSLKAVTQ